MATSLSIPMKEEFGPHCRQGGPHKTRWGREWWHDGSPAPLSATHPRQRARSLSARRRRDRHPCRTSNCGPSTSQLQRGRKRPLTQGDVQEQESQGCSSRPAAQCSEGCSWSPSKLATEECQNRHLVPQLSAALRLVALVAPRLALVSAGLYGSVVGLQLPHLGSGADHCHLAWPVGAQREEQSFHVNHGRQAGRCPCSARLD